VLGKGNSYKLKIENLTMTKVILISGLTENHVIGKDNTIPWHIKEDFQLFKEKTQDNVIIMGRNTWESLPKKPLPNRVNIVISKKIKKALQDEIILNSIDEAIKYCKRFYDDKDIFLIGGSKIYAEGLDYATHMYLSHIKKEYAGDTYFPEFDKEQWRVTEEKEYDEFVFKVWKKIK
jgi:dihydrofolate reductase